MNLALPNPHSVVAALGLFRSAYHRTLTLPQTKTLEWDLEMGPKQKDSICGFGGQLAFWRFF